MQRYFVVSMMFKGSICVTVSAVQLLQQRYVAFARTKTWPILRDVILENSQIFLHISTFFFELTIVRDVSALVMAFSMGSYVVELIQMIFYEIYHNPKFKNSGFFKNLKFLKIGPD